MQPENKSISMFAGFFIPMALIFFFISLSIHLIKYIHDIYIGHLSDGAPLQSAQYALTIIGSLIFVFLLIIGRRINLRNICFYVYLLFPVFIGIWTLVLTPFQESPHLLKGWEAFVYTLGTSLWTGGAIFFFWSFANNHFSFKQAGLYYPYFIIISLLIDFSVRHYIHRYLNEFNSGALIVNLNLALLVTGIVIFSLFTWADRLLPRIKHHFDKRKDEIDSLFGLDYRILIGLFTFSVAFLLAMSDSWLQASIEQYPRERVMSAMEYAATIFAFISIVLLIALSAFLYDQRGKGWRITAYIATGITVVSTLAWYIYMLGFDAASFMNAAAARHSALVFLSPFILVLKEMSFIAVPKNIRFITKTWVDLFFRLAGVFGAHAIILFFTAAFKTLENSIAYISIITLAVLAILVATTHIAGKRLQAFAP